MIEITQELGFDAAHFLENGAPENRRVHGHSFTVDLTLRGEADPATGMMRDLGEVRAVLAAIADSLDHRMLNDVPGLGAPTLENLARFVFRKARETLPEVARVRVCRPSCGQTCIYEEA